MVASMTPDDDKRRLTAIDWNRRGEKTAYTQMKSATSHKTSVFCEIQPIQRTSVNNHTKSCLSETMQGKQEEQLESL